MILPMRSCAALFTGMIAFTSLSGCNFLAFSDSSAMRIEVEVYKGPLSLEPEIQLQELYGYLLEAHTGVLRTCGFAGMFEEDSILNSILIGPISRETFETVLDDSRLLLGQLRRHILDLEGVKAGSDTSLPVSYCKTTSDAPKDSEARKERFQKFDKERANIKVQSFKQTNVADLTNILTAISKTAASMQLMAFRYATASTAGQPSYSPARIAATFFIEAVSEYGNQLEARADALLKQLGTYGRDRRELPLSTHLREAEPTDFLHLFDWMDGHIPRLLDYLYLNFSPDVPDRVKIVERLYADHFWSKINMVYASGRGKTQMAFIKDETGNWNLKSFANDPTELLESYSNVAKAALEKAATIAASASTGGAPASIAAARAFVSLATESEPDKAIAQSPPAWTSSLAHLRARLAENLDPAQFTADLEEEEKLLKALDVKDPDAAKTVQADLSRHRQRVIARWEAILNDHSNLVDILSSTVKKK